MSVENNGKNNIAVNGAHDVSVETNQSYHCNAYLSVFVQEKQKKCLHHDASIWI